jgi:Cu/Ag efflux pump CusA
MAELVSAEIRQNWNELTYDPIVIGMANDFAEGIRLGLITRADLPSISSLANETYRNAGGTINLLTLGSVVQAIGLLLDSKK